MKHTDCEDKQKTAFFGKPPDLTGTFTPGLESARH